MLWLIGGTQESAQLAQALSQAGVPLVVSVTSAAARSLYASAPQVQAWVGRLEAATLPAFLHQYGVRAILDASHPFAAEISRLALTAGLPYLRFERPSLTEILSSGQAFTSFEGLLASGALAGRRALLVVGYRPLGLFAPWQGRAVLFARILPSLEALQAALQAGFTPDRLVALRPPVPLDLERALWQHWQIDTLVSKASGTAGGEETKAALAAELGVIWLRIERPKLDYPQQTDSVEAAVVFGRVYGS